MKAAFGYCAILLVTSCQYATDELTIDWPYSGELHGDVELRVLDTASLAEKAFLEEVDLRPKSVAYCDENSLVFGKGLRIETFALDESLAARCGMSWGVNYENQGEVFRISEIPSCCCDLSLVGSFDLTSVKVATNVESFCWVYPDATVSNINSLLSQIHKFPNLRIFELSVVADSEIGGAIDFSPLTKLGKLESLRLDSTLPLENFLLSSIIFPKLKDIQILARISRHSGAPITGAVGNSLEQ